ncbi:hypothetical protein B0H16DRAFT_1480366 [Mycena metata]|uniref:Uncharacterized protein n=1 Tax=Mycena metata TaxID=1033252 RepID=A0AAD7H3D8_9AGAR|nr:hypothetical protein B0H16DRAFT_1480366 [Mycena metata]
MFQTGQIPRKNGGAIRMPWNTASDPQRHHDLIDNYYSVSAIDAIAGWIFPDEQTPTNLNRVIFPVRSGCFENIRRSDLFQRARELIRINVRVVFETRGDSLCPNGVQAEYVKSISIKGAVFTAIPHKRNLIENADNPKRFLTQTVAGVDRNGRRRGGDEGKEDNVAREKREKGVERNTTHRRTKAIDIAIPSQPSVVGRSARWKHNVHSKWAVNSSGSQADAARKLHGTVAQVAAAWQGVGMETAAVDSERRLG